MGLDVNSLKGMLDNKDTKDAINGIIGNVDVNKLLEDVKKGNVNPDSLKEMLKGVDQESLNKILASVKPEDLQGIKDKIGGADSSAADGLKNIIGGFMGGNK